MATDNKYDRQLRLWGANGQAALGAANVLLLGSSSFAQAGLMRPIGAGCAGTETLKNLVLPGIGSFMIIDGEDVGEADNKVNFFVRKSDVGRPRAAVTAELLQELNPDDGDMMYVVCGGHRVASPAEVLDREGEDLVRPFTLVVGAGLDPLALQRLAEVCWSASKPLVVARATGFIGSVRLQLRRHEIVESKPENTVWDLRLADPFEELDELLRAHAALEDDLSDADHAHTPFVLVLARLAATWKAAHAGAMPKTRDEKDAFRLSITSSARVLQSKV